MTVYPNHLSGYTQVRSLGRGTFGHAILYRVNVRDELVVIKSIKLNGLSAKQEALALNEVQVLASLRHPHCVKYLTSWVDSDPSSNSCHLRLVMEYCNGGDLAHNLQRYRAEHGPLPEELTNHWLVQILCGLGYLHSKKVVHRDLKTANLFLCCRNGATVVKIGDFGISAVLNSTLDLKSTHIGTPYYMAPEVVSHTPYGRPADVWALGCIGYELATGCRPYEAADLRALFRKIAAAGTPSGLGVAGTAAPTSGPFAGYSADFVEVVSACLRRSARRRPTVEQLLAHRLFVQAGTRLVSSLHGVYSERASEPHIARMVQVINAVTTVAAPAQLGGGRARSNGPDSRQVGLAVGIADMGATMGLLADAVGRLRDGMAAPHPAGAAPTDVAQAQVAHAAHLAGPPAVPVAPQRLRRRDTSSPSAAPAVVPSVRGVVGRTPAAAVAANPAQAAGSTPRGRLGDVPILASCIERPAAADPWTGWVRGAQPVPAAAAAAEHRGGCIGPLPLGNGLCPPPPTRPLGGGLDADADPAGAGKYAACAAGAAEAAPAPADSQAQSPHVAKPGARPSPTLAIVAAASVLPSRTTVRAASNPSRVGAMLRGAAAAALGNLASAAARRAPSSAAIGPASGASAAAAARPAVPSPLRVPPKAAVPLLPAGPAGRGDGAGAPPGTVPTIPSSDPIPRSPLLPRRPSQPPLPRAARDDLVAADPRASPCDSATTSRAFTVGRTAGGAGGQAAAASIVYACEIGVQQRAAAIGSPIGSLFPRPPLLRDCEVVPTASARDAPTAASAVVAVAAAEAAAAVLAAESAVARCRRAEWVPPKRPTSSLSASTVVSGAADTKPNGGVAPASDALDTANVTTTNLEVLSVAHDGPAAKADDDDAADGVVPSTWLSPDALAVNRAAVFTPVDTSVFGVAVPMTTGEAAADEHCQAIPKPTLLQVTSSCVAVIARDGDGDKLRAQLDCAASAAATAAVAGGSRPADMAADAPSTATTADAHASIPTVVGPSLPGGPAPLDTAQSPRRARLAGTHDSKDTHAAGAVGEAATPPARRRRVNTPYPTTRPRACGGPTQPDTQPQPPLPKGDETAAYAPPTAYRVGLSTVVVHDVLRRAVGGRVRFAALMVEAKAVASAPQTGSCDGASDDARPIMVARMAALVDSYIATTPSSAARVHKPAAGAPPRTIAPLQSPTDGSAPASAGADEPIQPSAPRSGADQAVRTSVLEDVAESQPSSDMAMSQIPPPTPASAASTAASSFELIGNAHADGSLPVPASGCVAAHSTSSQAAPPDCPAQLRTAPTPSPREEPVTCTDAASFYVWLLLVAIGSQ